MKESRRQGRKIHSLWNDLTSGILDKINNKNNISEKQNDDRDMGETHTPLSRLDLTGMNREQAKVLINKIIDEKLEMVSHIEMTELKIDYKERERQRAKAAERINERRNRRKQKNLTAAETIVTEQGVYSDYKHASVFDILQPESFPDEAHPGAPIEGQLSIMDAIAAAEVDQSVEYAKTVEPELVVALAEPVEPELVVALIESVEPELVVALAEPAEPVKFAEASVTAEPQETTAKLAFFDGVKINTSLDEAVDKVFAFYTKNKASVRSFCRKTQHITGEIVRGKVLPAAASGSARVNSKLIPLLQKIESKLKLKHKTALVLAKLAEREKRAAEKMVSFVDFIDRKNESFLNGIAFIIHKVSHRIELMRDWAEDHKKQLLIGFGIGVAGFAAITIMIGNMTAYEYIYNGKVLGVVKSQEDVYKTIDIIGDKLSVQYDADITINKEKDIRFNKIVAFHQDIDDKEAILNRLTYMRGMKAKGRGIYIDGKLVAVLESDKTAKAILSEIQNRYLSSENANIEYKKIDFAEDVTIEDVETKLGNIEAKEKALEYMMTGAVEKKIHLVQPGETFSEIAKMYGLKQSELKVSNPDVVPEKLHIGQEICLNQIVPLVTVQTTEVAQYIEAIPYEIQYENTGSLFKDEQTVKSRGANGEKDVVAEIVRNNGIEVSRKEISATILSEPVSQVVLVGTKDPPPLIGTGTFIYPIRGTLTSRYGTRWGRLHSGIDLAAPIGTHIKAADGGKVTFAGYNGALGYMVAIDHGGGRVSWYGHCSKLHVKKGDKVYQGQHIANVGNTGRSTGPHVHFEVHINGKTKNPLNYL